MRAVVAFVVCSWLHVRLFPLSLLNTCSVARQLKQSACLWSGSDSCMFTVRLWLSSLRSFGQDPTILLWDTNSPKSAHRSYYRQTYMEKWPKPIWMHHIQTNFKKTMINQVCTTVTKYHRRLQNISFACDHSSRCDKDGVWGRSSGRKFVSRKEKEHQTVSESINTNLLRMKILWLYIDLYIFI